MKATCLVSPMTCIRALSSISKKYYDSQSGGFITVGGGTRIHDTTFALARHQTSPSLSSFDPKLLQKVLDMKPNSLEVDVSLLEQIAHSSPTLPPLYLKIEQDIMFNALNAELRAAIGGYIVDMRVSDSAHTRAEKLGLVKKLHDAGGKPVRALCHCDLSASGSSSVISTGGIIGDLVDSGACSVILHSDKQPLDADVCRNMLEEVLYLDCAGDPMKQRLGMHISLRGEEVEDVLQQAVDLGVMHFTCTAEVRGGEHGLPRVM